MKFIYLELDDFKRIALNGIDKFKMDFKEPLQLILGSNGSGKAQPLDAKIKVPNGWQTMAEMTIGTKVITKDGSTTTVTGVFPQGEKQIYRITFEDGRSTTCCLDHLWKVYLEDTSLSTVMTTKEIDTHLKSMNLFIDLPDAESNESNNLRLNKIGDAPIKYRQNFLKLLLGLNKDFDFKSDEATIKHSSECFINTIKEVARSLGGRARSTMLSTPSPSSFKDWLLVKDNEYVINISFKSSLLQIKSIEAIGVAQAQCISIAHPSNLYITDDYIVTHNTSVLDQITPLPPNHQDFKKSGRKLIGIEHNNSEYRLLSTFDPSQKHSFVKDNVELNEGGTVTIQRELVKEHFGITQDIQDLILGKDTFDRMTASKRKEWFIRLCETNYDYAIKVYNNLKERHRDITGAIKVAKKRLSLESEKLLQSDEQAKLDVEIKSIHSVLSVLLENRKPVEQDLAAIATDQEKLDAELMSHCTALENIQELLRSNELSQEQIDSKIKQLDMELYSISKIISELTQAHGSNLKKITILQKAEKATIESLREQIATLKGSLGVVNKGLLVQELSNPELCHSRFESIKSTLVEIFDAIPTNKSKRFSVEKLTQARKNLSELKLKKENAQKDLEARLAKLKHMQEHRDNPDLTCPKCTHRFSLNYNLETYNKLEINAEELERTIETKIKPDISRLEEYVEECSNYGSLFRQWVVLTNSNPELGVYWNYLNNLQIITDKPRQALAELNRISLDINNQISRSTLEQNINDKESTLKSLQDLGGVDLNTLLEENVKLDERIQSLSTKQSSHNVQRAKLVKIRECLTKSVKIIASIRECITEKKKLNRDELETIRRQCLNDTIRTIQSYLSTKESLLYNITNQKAIVQDITNQIAKQEQDEIALKLNLTQLSPTDGLIAEGLLGFISSFVEQMNHFIKKIWSYPLVVKSCSVEDNQTVDLDYKFPVVVNTQNNVISDISKGSTGMLEIINLAFRITAMQYLGLKQYPLGLDEWGASFDSVHRTQAVETIKSLIEQNIFNQLFVISHYAESFGALSNPDICVLDDTNIDLPKLDTLVNKNVVIN